MTRTRFPAPDLSFTRRDVALGLLIVLLAFALRLIVISDRAHAPHATSAFDPLPAGSDQLTYYEHIAAYRAGEFPPDRFYYQPGMSYFMIGASRILRTDNLGALRVLVAALGAINCGLFVAVARLAFGRRDVGLLSGLLLAVYPVAIFFDTDFVITSQALVLVTLALFGVLWLWRQPANWTGAILYGASMGVLAFTRFDATLLAPVFGLWLIAVRRDSRAVRQVALAAAIAIAILSPVMIHNLRHDANYLITPVGAEEVYRGNNRDASGVFLITQTTRTTNDDHLHYLWQDIRLSPRRFGELILHKIGLFLSPEEPGNNLDYATAGESASPLLRSIPLDFRTLAALGMLGTVLALRRREPAASLLILGSLTLMVAILMIWVEARLRTPVIVFLIPLAAYALARVVDHARHAERDALWNADARAILLAIPAIGAVLFAAHLANRHLPRPLTVGTLPGSAQVANVTYDDTLRLAGWEIQNDYSRAGIINPYKPYVVTLYWELLQDTDTDYSFTLAYYVDGERVLGFDHPIGQVGYPPHPTSEWDTGAIYVEHVGLAYESYEGPVGISGDLLLGVYPERDAAALIAPQGVPGSPAHVTLAHPAIIWDNGVFPPGLSHALDAVPFGDVLTLHGWDAPEQVAPGASFDVTLGWQTTGTPITRNLIFSVQLLDEANQPAAQHDSPPHNGRLRAASLPTNYRLGDTKTLTAPADPGTYRLVVLVYDYDSGTRLDVPAEPDDILTLGTLTISDEAPAGQGDDS